MSKMIDLGVIPSSGVNSEHKVRLTYDNNTRWYYLDDPYPRLRSKGNLSLFDFHKLMVKTLDAIDDKIVYVPSYPDYVMDNEYGSNIDYNKQAPKRMITYNTIRSEPGKISAGPPFQGTGVKEIKKRVREQLFIDPIFRKDIDNPTDDLRYYKSTGQWFDNLVQFDLWTKTNYEAETFIEWFEDYLDRYTGMFKELGMHEMAYYRRVRDDTLLRWKNKLTVRSLIYYFRTEKLNVTEIRPIKRITIDTKVIVNNLYSASELDEDEDKIIKKWLKIGGK